MRAAVLLFAGTSMLFSLACAARNDAASRDSAAGTNATASDANAVRQAIESANQRFIETLKRGDTSAITDNYATDAMVMMPNEASWRGTAAVRKGFAGLLSQTAVKDFKGNTEDVMVGGDLAVETGTYEWTLVPKGGGEIKDKGKYMTVWKRASDGTWKIVRDINNSDLPTKM